MTEQRQFFGTFSICDYRTPRFRQALLLFDKIVVPVPTEPVKGSGGKITVADLKRLSAELQFLEDNGAAIRVEWSRREFAEWRESKAGEAISQLLDRDRQFATRFQVQEGIERALEKKGMVKREGSFQQLVPAGAPITVTPVYGDWQEYHSVWKGGADTQFVEIVAAQTPMPADDSPLEVLIELRSRESVKSFMPAFRNWQSQVVLNLVNAQGDETIIRRATQDASGTLAEWTEQFKKDVGAIVDKKVAMGFVSLLALLDIPHNWLTALPKLVPALFSFRELRRPWWTSVASKPWAPAGIVYEASRSVFKG